MRGRGARGREVTRAFLSIDKRLSSIRPPSVHRRRQMSEEEQQKEASRACIEDEIMVIIKRVAVAGRKTRHICGVFTIN